MENGIQYEIISKATGEVYLTTAVEFGTDEVTVKTDTLGDIKFSNIGQVGNLLNDEYVIRDAETKLAPNGVDTVEDVVPSVPETVPETTTEAAPEVVPETVG